MASDRSNDNDTDAVEIVDIEKPKKKSRLGLFIGIIVVVILLGGGGAAFYFLGMSPASAEEGNGSETLAEEISETDIYFSGFNSNVVNLAVSEEYDFMYLKYGFDVEVSDQAVIAELSQKLPRLTGVVSMVMSNQNYTEICTPQGHDRLIRNLIDALNENLESGTVIGVHFHTFVAQ